MLEIFILFLVGIGVGTFGTLVGIGGGLIMIPLFTFALTPSIFQSAPQIIGTSLFGVFLNAISGTFAYIRQKRVYFKAAVPFALATLPGAFLGGLVSDYFTGPTFSLAYGIFILFIAIIMYWNSSNKKVIAGEFNEKTFLARKKLGIFLSGFVGFISSIFGIGGGVIHVPTMIYALAFPPHMATATSHFVLAVSSFFGVISHIMLDHIVWV
ncbi:MAG TPA: sulfite exporter TauE/SafE family protein, partial [Megamonas hypermegale]|nr:sulfite exporter TauE/SafE family protein [Megamonas hypermegale]